MSSRGGAFHEALLKKTIEELRLAGYKVIDPDCKIPDAIAIKNGKLIAIEILPKKKSDRNVREKQLHYRMYDEIIFRFFKPNSQNSFVSYGEEVK